MILDESTNPMIQRVGGLHKCIVDMSISLGMHMRVFACVYVCVSGLFVVCVCVCVCEAPHD